MHASTVHVWVFNPPRGFCKFDAAAVRCAFKNGRRDKVLDASAEARNRNARRAEGSLRLPSANAKGSPA